MLDVGQETPPDESAELSPHVGKKGSQEMLCVLIVLVVLAVLGLASAAFWMVVLWRQIKKGGQK